MVRVCSDKDVILCCFRFAVCIIVTYVLHADMCRISVDVPFDLSFYRFRSDSLDLI